MVHKPVQHDQTSMSKLIAIISNMKLFIWGIKLSISSIFQHDTMMNEDLPKPVNIWV